MYRPTEIPSSVALCLADSDGTEPAGVPDAKPNRSFGILQQGRNDLPGNFCIFPNFPVLQTGQPLFCGNPESAVARNQKGLDPIAGEFLTVWRLPRDGLDTIEMD